MLDYSEVELNAQVQQVAEALWSGKAVAMVGSGFSRSAVQRTRSAPSFPTWPALNGAMIGKLSPPCKGCSCLEDFNEPPHAFEFGSCDKTRRLHRRRYYGISQGTSGSLRLAELVETSTDRAVLLELIDQLIPDRQYEPGKIHQEFVRLPWYDIYTTNWDSLLERSIDLYDRRYSVVHNRDDIATSSSPRIVKLHGTLDRGSPMIVTEEDYRTYDQERPYFVNMMRQTLMEKNLCLFGFSGDDPNFLEWLGWVRDVLGSTAKKVYFIDLDDHLVPQRRLLIKKHISPVDLSPLVKDITPSNRDDMYREAYQNFFIELRKYKEELRPNKIWPGSPSHTKLSLASDKKNRPTKKWIKEQAEVWATRRQLDPGWLLLQRRTRLRLHQKFTDSWNASSVWTDDNFGADRIRMDANTISLFGHWSWAVQRSLVVPPQALLSKIRWIMLAIYLDRVAEHDRSANSDIFAELVSPKMLKVDLGDSDNIVTGLPDMLKLMLWSARHRFSPDEFAMWVAVATDMSFESGDIKQVLSHEIAMYCLQAEEVLLSDGELIEISQLLTTWKTPSDEAAWRLRLAGILAEVGRLREVEATLADSVEQTRSLRRHQRDPAFDQSREAWAYWRYHSFIERRKKSRSTSNLITDLLKLRYPAEDVDVIATELIDRLDEITLPGCMPRVEMSLFENMLDKEVLVSQIPKSYQDTSSSIVSGEIGAEYLLACENLGLPVDLVTHSLTQEPLALIAARTVALRSSNQDDVTSEIRYGMALGILLRASPDTFEEYPIWLKTATEFQSVPKTLRTRLESVVKSSITRVISEFRVENRAAVVPSLRRTSRVKLRFLLYLINLMFECSIAETKVLSDEQVTFVLKLGKSDAIEADQSVRETYISLYHKVIFRAKPSSILEHMTHEVIGSTGDQDLSSGSSRIWLDMFSPLSERPDLDRVVAQIAKSKEITNELLQAAKVNPEGSNTKSLRVTKRNSVLDAIIAALPQKKKTGAGKSLKSKSKD